MHTRRLATLILGLWIGLTLAMFVVATQNFSGVERLLAAPASEAGMSIQTLGRGTAHALLRYQVSELNRFYFEWFSIAQIVLSILLGIALLLSTNGNKLILGLALALTIIVIFEKVWMVPEITFLGRTIDFVPKDVDSPARSRFWSFHIAYSVLEVIKMGMLAGIGVKLLIRSTVHRKRPMRSSEVNEEVVALRG